MTKNVPIGKKSHKTLNSATTAPQNLWFFTCRYSEDKVCLKLNIAFNGIMTGEIPAPKRPLVAQNRYVMRYEVKRVFGKMGKVPCRDNAAKNIDKKPCDPDFIFQYFLLPLLREAIESPGTLTECIHACYGIS